MPCIISFGSSIKALHRCLDKFCPEMSEAEKYSFLYAYFPFMYGIYPYAVVTDKQRQAMEEANVGFRYYSIYELAYNCLCKLLSVGKGEDEA